MEHLIGILLIAVTIELCLGRLLVVELLDKDSLLNSWLWCRKHGLKYKSQACAIGGGVIFWWGEDKDGNSYVRGADGEPRMVDDVS